MEAQFDGIGLNVERLAATTPDTIKAEDIAPLALDDILQILAPPEIAISISHFRAWRHMLDRGHRQMIVMEDDILLSPLLPSFLAGLEIQDRDFDLLRLETRESKVLLDARAEQGPAGIALHRPLSYEAGAGAYVVSAAYAARILESRDRFCLPFDDILFSLPSPFRNVARLWTAVPALALSRSESSREVSANILVSDADAGRAAHPTERAQREKAKSKGLRKVRREIMRVWQRIAIAWKKIFLGQRTHKMIVPFAGSDARAASPATPPPA